MFSASTPSNPFIPQDSWLFFLSMNRQPFGFTRKLLTSLEIFDSHAS